ncbi:hypothetical protein D6D18_06936 [Aureobasidium pullulans]|nr:hypothetical protein D6D18_06936 [Aureobasidium pullulans]
MADLNDARNTSLSTASTQEGKRVKIVHLSGPIRIILETDEPMEVETVTREQLELDGTERASPANNDKDFRVVCPSGPIKIHLPVDQLGAFRTVSSEELCDNNEGQDTLFTPIDKNKPSATEFDCNNPDDTLSPFCPYIPGNEILLKASETGRPIRAKILKYFPATLSCCMVIRFLDPPIFNNTSECVLKLFDRRFSTQQREEREPWSPELENKYQKFVRCGDAEELFSYWNAEKENFDEWSSAYVRNSRRWSAVKWETYLHWMSTTMYKVEKKAYEHMTDLQGEAVPKMLGEVVLDQAPVVPEGEDDPERMEEDSASISSIDPDEHSEVVSISGLLLQHIEGFHMTDVHEHLPYEHWQSTVDSAIEVLHRIQACGILNRDINTRSFIVNPLTRKVMMIDYGLVGFREDCEDEQTWDMVQANQDEEGAVGQVMRAMLKSKGDGGKGIVYKPSERAWRLLYRFGSEEGEMEGGTEEEDGYVEKHKDFVFDK